LKPEGARPRSEGGFVIGEWLAVNGKWNGHKKKSGGRGGLIFSFLHFKKLKEEKRKNESGTRGDSKRQTLCF
jgi:hypothetical protein